MRHALLNCCRRPHTDQRIQWEGQMAQAMCEGQVIRRDGLGRSGSTIQWFDISDDQNDNDQNEEGAGGGTTGDMAELKKKKCQNTTRLEERIHMHYSIVLAGSVQRPSQLSLTVLKGSCSP